MLFTIYKEIQIGFGKLINQYKQDWQNPEFDDFWENIQKIGILEKVQDKKRFLSFSWYLNVVYKIGNSVITTKN